MTPHQHNFSFMHHMRPLLDVNNDSLLWVYYLSLLLTQCLAKDREEDKVKVFRMYTKRYDHDKKAKFKEVDEVDKEGQEAKRLQDEIKRLKERLRQVQPLTSDCFKLRKY